MKAILQKLASLWSLVGLCPRDKLEPYYNELVTLIQAKDKEKKSVKTNDSSQFIELADKLIAEYKNVVPDKTPGGYPFVSSRTVIAERLGSSKLNISKFSEEDIILATRLYLKEKYTNALKEEKKYCATLPYFIWKMKDGVFSSPLLDYITIVSERKEKKEDILEDKNDFSWLY